MKAVDIKSLVGAKVRRLREKARWSQENLGFESGLHRNYIGGIERGERNVALRNIEKIADALGISISDLMDGI